MRINSTSMCALEDISGLSTHLNAEDAMIAFCKLRLIPDVGNFRYGLERPSGYKSIYSFFIFSCAIYEGEPENYGENFANYIRKFKLGSLKASPVRVNSACHPDHSNRVWIWSPDQSKLEKHWEKLKEIDYWRPPINKVFGPPYEPWRFGSNANNYYSW